MILTQRPGHTIGRLCLAIGLLLGLHLALMGLVGLVDVRPGPLPPVLVAGAVIAGPLQLVAVGLTPALLARFPSGRLPGRRWRVVDLGVALLVIAAAVVVIQPGPTQIDWILETPNPLGLAGFPAEATSAAYVVAVFAGTLAAVLSAVALTLTYRRADRQGRAQIRWVLLAVTLLIVTIIGAIAVPAFGEIGYPAIQLAAALVPIGIGVAILRYHLYEIDRIVRRTIVYGAITGLLAAAFLATNLTLVTVLAPVVGSNEVVVAISTLLVAAIAAPLRERVQRVVDRRFNRARYDAERTVVGLADRLRDEVDLDAIRRLTLASTAGAVEPASAALWLRGASSGGPDLESGGLIRG
jgi:hypothetical protein